MTEPEVSLFNQPVSGTSMLEGIAKALQDVPKDKRHQVSFSFYTLREDETTLTAKLLYTYKENLEIGGYVTKELSGPLEVGGIVNWRS